jgi:hypothetical protein
MASVKIPVYLFYSLLIIQIDFYLHIAGVYTTMRTIERKNIMSLDYHIDRLTDNLQNFVASNPNVYPHLKSTEISKSWLLSLIKPSLELAANSMESMADSVGEKEFALFILISNQGVGTDNSEVINL